MRIIITTLAATLVAASAFGLTGCASISTGDMQEFQVLSAEAIEPFEPGIAAADIAISGLHGFMLNTHWTATTKKGRYGCMRDLTGTPECEKR